MRKFLLLFVALSFVFSWGASSRSLRRISAGTADTLEICVIRVEFKKEETDNSLTTGRGTFGSDADTASANYSLDPQSNRGSAAYWEKHFEFARNYFLAASNGKLVIEANIYPKNKSAYTLDKYIIDYNRTERKKGEKLAEFDSIRSLDYMNFVWDAVHKAHANLDDSPFRDSLPQSPNRHRAYMIIHAGASRLVDGGSLGTSGANTPGDFMDAFVQQSYWDILSSATDAERRTDSKGMILANSGLDTLRNIMVMSETASQDGLNWGINGTLVFQIARQIGMPSSYDISKGFSRLGYFDLMDFAGYNAGNGFLPVLPNAWQRAYMGWASVREVRPGSGLSLAAIVGAIGSNQGDEILKIPLTQSEYLLIENRQRTQDPSGLVTVELDQGNKSLSIDSIAQLFEDSTCTNAGCKVNTKKAKGIITGLSSYDIGLPASGLTVLHVNDWFVRDALKCCEALNVWNGDDVRDHQFGIALVEADRILSIGKEFKNALGQSAFDYGSGSDLLPNWRFATTNQQGLAVPHDTTFQILPDGYSNSGTTFGGLSGIRIIASIPADAAVEKTANSFLGDSVMNWRSKQFPVRIEWNNQWMPDAQWPRTTLAINSPSQLITVNKPANLSKPGKKIVVAASQDGTLQAFAFNGDSVLTSDTTALRDERYPGVSSLLETTRSIDSAAQVAIYRLGPSAGPLVGTASESNRVWSLHLQQLERTTIDAAGSILAYTQNTLVLPASAKLGPLVTPQGIWIGDSLGLRLASAGTNLQWLTEQNWPQGFTPMQFALCGDQDGDGISDLAIVGSTGTVLLRNSSSGVFLPFAGPTNVAAQHFQMACTDFNRDGKGDAFVLGETGIGWILSLTDGHFIAPARTYRRTTKVTMDSITTQIVTDNSPIALGDVNGDRYPDAVFFGDNIVYAIDSSGVPLNGFPAKFNKGLTQYGFGESPLLVDVDGKGGTSILASAPNGLLYAFNAQGKLRTDGWPRPVGDFRLSEYVEPMGILLDDADTVAGLELFTTHRDLLNGFNMLGALATPGANWTQAYGGNERQNWFDAATLGEPGALAAVNSISEFIMFPNPVRGSVGKVRFTLGAPATSVTLRLYDLGGKEVLVRKLGTGGQGRNQVEDIDVKQLGSDIYAVCLEVVFANGKKKLAWDRIGRVK